MRLLIIFILFAPPIASSTSLFASDTIYYELWDMNSLELIGGHEVTVLGDPQMVNTDIGDAIKFDGDMDQLLVDFNPIRDAIAFTIELVFKPDASYPDNPDPRVVHIQDPNDPDEKRVMMELRIDKNNECYMDGFMKTDIENLTLMDESLVHPTETWQHIAITYNANILTTYFNGAKETYGVVNHSIKIVNTLGKTSLGARMNEKKYFAGVIKTLKITHAALEPKDFIFINEDTVSSTDHTFLMQEVKEVRISPNPVNQELKLKMFGIKNRRCVEVKISDSSGKIFYSHKSYFEQQDTITIDTSEFQDGVYWVSLQSDQLHKSVRMIVLH